MGIIITMIAAILIGMIFTRTSCVLIRLEVAYNRALAKQAGNVGAIRVGVQGLGCSCFIRGGGKEHGN